MGSATPTHHIAAAVGEVRDIAGAEAALEELYNTDGRVNGAHKALFVGFRQLLVLCAWLVRNARESIDRERRYRRRIEALEEKLTSK